jgi:hypothetical protein
VNFLDFYLVTRVGSAIEVELWLGRMRGLVRQDLEQESELVKSCCIANNLEKREYWAS